MLNREILAERFKNLRLEKSISQQDIAASLGVDRSIVSHWERGTRIPSLDIAYALADYFNVSLDYLVGRSDDSTYR
ncbi:helix-turn-helix domain-containing protein [Paenibacillus lentus]|uniref:XRE family transcriptional regulator n=1 Tax=Paenibacillus lentus TaxID=1338368 RepID=A0A3Q8S3G2_9BACL|nr:helix-turn-helix transcriptional regulator [Paenibacillus lentus]AZK45029.1 XRE family transcriptional regulator [Paenibacillus lentus]